MNFLKFKWFFNVCYSYSNMSYIVDHLFPPIREAANDYSQFVYWREPMQNIEELPEIISLS